MTGDPRADIGASLHPLLFAACRCSPAAEFLCLACRRWIRHRQMVVERRARWRREAAR